MRSRWRFALGAFRLTREERDTVHAALITYRKGHLWYDVGLQTGVRRIEELLIAGRRKEPAGPIFSWNEPKSKEPGAH